MFLFCSIKGERHEFNFTIEEWSPEGRRDAVHAGANNITVARIAYEEHKRQTPHRLIIAEAASAGYRAE